MLEFPQGYLLFMCYNFSLDRFSHYHHSRTSCTLLSSRIEYHPGPFSVVQVCLAPCTISKLHLTLFADRLLFISVPDHWSLNTVADKIASHIDRLPIAFRYAYCTSLGGKQCIGICPRDAGMDCWRVWCLMGTHGHSLILAVSWNTNDSAPLFLSESIGDALILLFFFT